jgi:ribose transport system substrate-binding protein
MVKRLGGKEVRDGLVCSETTKRMKEEDEMVLSRWRKVLCFAVALVVALGFSAYGAPNSPAGKKIGVMLSWATNEWYVSVMDGFKKRADELGIKYTIADSENDLQKGISIIDTFVEEGVDGVLLIPSTYPGYESVIKRAQAKKIPVISDVVKMAGVTVFAGNEQFNMTRETGKETGKYILSHWPKSKPVNVLTVNIPSLPNLNGRTDGFLMGLIESGVKFNWIQEVDGQGVITTSLEVSTAAFQAHPEINLVFGINDDSMFGALKAAQQLNLDLDGMVFVGTGLEGAKSRQQLLSKGPYKFGTSMFPGTQGVGYVNLFVDIWAGKKVPFWTIWPSKAVSADNFSTYFSADLQERPEKVLSINVPQSKYPAFEGKGWDRGWYEIYKKDIATFRKQFQY